jgi:hypothetical protein
MRGTFEVGKHGCRTETLGLFDGARLRTADMVKEVAIMLRGAVPSPVQSGGVSAP